MNIRSILKFFEKYVYLVNIIQNIPLFFNINLNFFNIKLTFFYDK